MECPKCQRSDVRVFIQKCQDCGQLFCWRCSGHSGYGKAPCPSCSSSNTATYREHFSSADGDGQPRPHW